MGNTTLTFTVQFDLNPASMALKSLDTMTGLVSGRIQQRMSSALAGITMPKLDPLDPAIDAELKKLTADVNAYQISVSSASKSSADLGNTLDRNTSQFGAVGSRIIAVNQALEAMQKVWSFLRKPVEIAGMFEQYQVQFGVLLRSEDEAKKRIQELADFANRTPFELPEVVRASKLLQTFGGSALASGRTLEMVGDMASAAGAGFEEVAMWVGRAYTSIKAGQPFGEASMRLMELGLMSGETRTKLEQLQESGARADEVWRVFVGSMDQYNGMMERQSRTLGGMVSTMSDSFNKLLADVGNVFMPAVKQAVDIITTLGNGIGSMSDSMKLALAGFTGLAAAGLLLNSSLGPTPYIIIGIVSAFGFLSKAIKDGNVPLMAFIGLVAAASAGLLVLKLQGIAAAVVGLFTFTTTTGIAVTGVAALRAQILALNAALLSNPYAAAVAAIVALGVVIYSLWKSQEDAKAEADAAMVKSTKAAVDAMIAEYKRLDNATASKALKFDINTAKAKVEANRQALGEVQDRLYGKVGADGKRDPSTRKPGDVSQNYVKLSAAEKAAQDNLKLWQDRLSQLEAYDKDAKTYAASASASPKRGIEIERARIDAMREGYEKRKALIANELKDQEYELQQRKNSNDKDAINEKQYNDLIAAYRAQASNKLLQLNEERRREELQARADEQRADQELENARLATQLDNGEKMELAGAKTEAARLEITTRFAHARVQLEYESAQKILGIESKMLSDELSGTPDEERKKAIQKRQAEIERKRQELNQTAGTKHAGVDVNYQVSAGKMPTADSIAAAQEQVRLAEEELNRATTDAARAAAREKLKAHQDALNKMTMKSDEYAAHQKEMWLKEHKVAGTAINIIGDGVRDMWHGIASVNRQAANMWDGLWLGIENAALKAIGDILASIVENGLLSILSSIIPGAGDALTAGKSGGGGLFGFIGSLLGFAEGGRVERPTIVLAGEAGGAEIIAPEKSFYDVAREEIIPNINAIALQQVGRVGSYNLSDDSVRLARAQRIDVHVTGELTGNTRKLHAALKSVDRLNKKYRGGGG